MYRVYVAWNADDARRFLGILRTHGIDGRVIEDQDFPSRGEIHESEASAEVWIRDPAKVARAIELASEFDSARPAADRS